LSYLLDTNIISQLTKPTPNSSVIDWLGAVEESETFLSVITLEEIRERIELLPQGRRKRNLDTWLARDLPERFAGRIIPIDDAIADRCGRMVASCRSEGSNPDALDALIAATALVHGMTVVTLNRKHFEPFPVSLITF